ncbi:MAG: hypothetical protein IJB76_04630 [Clostridia bacterium]|nr:hypothetical protein [Clostridia bacterium]
MNKYFSCKLYLRGLKRGQALGIGTLLSVTLLNLITPLSMMNYKSASVQPADDALITAVSLIMIFAPIIIYRMFSFVNNRASSDFYHSIPCTRLCLYTSFMAAGLTWILGTIIISILTCYAVLALSPSYTVQFFNVLSSILNFSMACLFLSGCTAVGMMAGGIGITAVTVFGIIAGYSALLPTVFSEIVSIYSPATVLSGWLDGSNAPLSSFYYLRIDYVLLINVIISLAIIALGALLFVKRNSETAGKPAANRLVQHLIRCLVALPICLMYVYNLAWNLNDPYPYTQDAFSDSIPALLIVGFVVYFLYELITVRKVKSMLRSMPVYLLVIAFAFAFWGGASALGKTLKNTYPKSGDDISSVTFEDPIYIDVGNFGLEMNGYTTDKEVLYAIVHEINECEYWASSVVSVSFKNGDVKKYKLPYSSELQQTIAQIINTKPERLETMLKLHDRSTASCSDAVWDSFVSEYNSLSFKEKIKVHERSYTHGYDEHGKTSSVYIIEGKTDDYEYYSYNVYKRLMPKTYALLEKQDKQQDISTQQKLLFLV